MIKNGVADDSNRNKYDGDLAKQSVEVGDNESGADKVEVGIGKGEVGDDISEEGEIDDLEEGELKSDEDSVTGSMHSNEKSIRRPVSFISFFMHESSVSRPFCRYSSVKGSESRVKRFKSLPCD